MGGGAGIGVATRFGVWGSVAVPTSASYFRGSWELVSRVLSRVAYQRTSNAPGQTLRANPCGGWLSLALVEGGAALGVPPGA